MNRVSTRTPLPEDMELFCGFTWRISHHPDEEWPYVMTTTGAEMRSDCRGNALGGILCQMLRTGWSIPAKA